jgi:putative ABC transport system substrate-binding protein
VIVLRQALEAARILGIRLQAYEVRSVEDFSGAFALIAKQRPDALIVIGDQLTHQHRGEIAQFALHAHLPSMFDTKDSVTAGGLMSYGPSYIEMSRNARFYAEKLLKGANPADLPFEQASKFELVVSLKTAKALGSTVPQSILLRADGVIK